MTQQHKIRLSLDISHISRIRRRPFFLMDSYEFFKFSIFEQPCLLMVSKETTEITPGLISKHYEQIQKICSDCIIYAKSTISSYNRKR